MRGIIASSCLSITRQLIADHLPLRWARKLRSINPENCRKGKMSRTKNLELHPTSATSERKWLSDGSSAAQGAWPFFANDEIEAAVQVLRSGNVNYWTGQEGRFFETEFAAFTGCKY